MRSSAIIFPTFAARRPDASVRLWPLIGERLEYWWQRARTCVDVEDDAEAFRAGREPLTVSQTRQAHYACFIEGVAAAEWAAARTSCAVVVPHSMGLFAGYHVAGALEFEEALQLMDRLCLMLHEQRPFVPCSTGAIAGLPRIAVDELLASALAPVWIADWYDDDVFLVSGSQHAVEDILERAAARGATYTKSTPATAPYHTPELVSFEESARQCLAGVIVSPPRIPVISSIDGRVSRTADDVRREVARNACHPMNWRAAIKMLASNAFRVDTVVECGSSVSLTEMIRHHLPIDSAPATIAALARETVMP